MITSRPERETAEARSRRLDPSPAVESEGARRELVRRIVRSPTFARSERLGTLLTFVCDLALKGRESEINEHTIGHAVFGRLRDYDSAVDGIVRSQASRLRQRLELYFQQEGADEPIRVMIPRGGYVPLFQAQSVPAPPLPIANPSALPLETPSAISAEISEVKRTYTFLLGWGVSFFLASMLVMLWVRDHRQQTTATTVKEHPFWSQLFQRKQATMIVAPDSGLVLFHGMSGQEIDLKSYLDAGYRSGAMGIPQTTPNAPQKDWFLDVANRRYTSMVDVDTIVSLKDRARTLGSEVSVRYARDLRPNDLKTGTVILLGMSSANPWVELFENEMNFVLKDDFAKSFWVINRNPQKGEPERWVSLKNDPQRRVFGVVAFVPNLAHDGDALLIEGISMSGTEAAMQFLNDDARLLPFLNQIRRTDGTLPHFEVLLATHNIASSAVRSEILAWRTRD